MLLYKVFLGGGCFPACRPDSLFGVMKIQVPENSVGAVAVGAKSVIAHIPQKFVPAHAITICGFSRTPALEERTPLMNIVARRTGNIPNIFFPSGFIKYGSIT